MTTSREIFTLSKPTGDEPIPAGTLGYFRARNKHRVYSLVLDEFRKSGVSQAEVSRRLRKAPEVVCRLLGAPGNWTLDTVSDLLFAISGSEPAYSISYPLEKPARNYSAHSRFVEDFSTASSDTISTNWKTRISPSVRDAEFRDYKVIVQDSGPLFDNEIEETTIRELEMHNAD